MNPLSQAVSLNWHIATTAYTLAKIPPVVLVRAGTFSVPKPVYTGKVARFVRTFPVDLCLTS